MQVSSLNGKYRLWFYPIRDTRKEYGGRSATCRAQIWNKLLSPAQDTLSVTFSSEKVMQLMPVPSDPCVAVTAGVAAHLGQQLLSCNCVPSKSSLEHYWSACASISAEIA